MHADSEPNHTVTHGDLAREAGVSVTTIKSYRRKFPGFIPVAGYGKPIRFKPEATDVCLLIRDCFAKGMSVRETRTRLEAAGHAQDAASVPPPQDAHSASRERMDEFLRAAGVMMQSVAQLADAQRKTDARLDRLESLIEQLAGVPSPEVAPASPARPKPARRVVKVRSSEGNVDSYALDDHAMPPDSLLDVPVAIQAGGGDFLGLPGRLTLRDLATRLAAEQAWTKEADCWQLALTAEDGTVQGLGFASQDSPSGMALAVMTRLIVNGLEATPEQRMDYFRQIKDLYAA